MALISCRCCFSLRTSGIILAVLAAISSLIMFINGISSEAGVISALQGAGIIFYILCIYGIDKEKPGLIMPSLIWSLVSTILVAVIWILFVVSYYQMIVADPDRCISPEQKLGFYSLFYGFSAALSLYFWWVMYSLYQLLKNPSVAPFTNGCTIYKSVV